MRKKSHSLFGGVSEVDRFMDFAHTRFALVLLSSPALLAAQSRASFVSISLAD